MGNLYRDLAGVYEAMYKTFIDYEDEYRFYSNILKKYGKNELLEIGSGTGDLASFFVKKGFTYSGLDYSKAMIEIAESKGINCAFVEGDMRQFHLPQPVESIIMAGRTISYLVTNDDVNSAFAAIGDNLQPSGIFCFDIIDADKFIPQIIEQPTVHHEASDATTSYLRKGTWKPNFEYGMDVEWTATYYKEIAEKWVEIGRDYSIVRTFFKNEVAFMLANKGFTIKHIIERPSYYFPTYVIVAQKNP